MEYSAAKKRRLWIAAGISFAAVALVAGGVALAEYKKKKAEEKAKEPYDVKISFNGVENSTLHVDPVAKAASVSIQPLKVSHPEGTFDVASQALPEGLLPANSPIRVEFNDAEYVNHSSFQPGLDVLHLFVGDIKGSVYLRFTWSPHSGSNTRDPTHDWQLPAGDFEVLKPISVSWKLK